MHTFNIRLFGAIEVFQNGQPITHFRSQKTLVLLAYLISRERPLTREYLAGLFWPEATKQEALGHLRRALHNLSKNLPGCLDVNRRTAAFRADASAVVDIRRLEALAKEGDIESLTEAAALLRAPFLEGIYFADCPELELWIAAEQERWQQQAITLLGALARAASGEGQYDRALAYAQKLAALDPLQEAHHRQVMLLYAKTGKREAALAQYAIGRDLLAEELGINLSPETTALYQRIREVTAVRHNLPPSPTPFIGRQTELAALGQMLANPDCRLITIAGPGGIGKTRLALALARRSAVHFLEGVWFAGLVDVFTPAGLLTALGAALNLPFAPGRHPAGQLIDYLRGKEMALLLDNFEQLADAPDLLAEILRETTAVKLVVTSRRPLNLQEEWIFDLDGLPTPQAGETGNLLAFEAARLFDEAAHRRCPRFDLAANGTAVIQICQIVQGIPLALELAAAACREMPCASIAEGISGNLDLLQTPLRNVPERHRSVQAVFNHSWKLLDEAAQSAYARLSLFRGSFSAAAAEAVTKVSQKHIRPLVEHSLLKRTGESRYELHELLRQYARDKLEQNQALANQMAFRHAEYFTKRLVEQGANRRDMAHTAVTLDLGNIVAAWQWAAGHGQWQLLAQSAAHLRDYFLDVGSPQEGVAHLDEASAQLEAALAVPTRRPAPPGALAGRLLAHKAHLLVRSGQSDASRQTARQVLALVADAPDPAAEGEAAYVLAFADFTQGSYGPSRQLAEAGLELAQQNDLGRLAALCLNQAGRCCLETNDLDAAQAYFEQTAVLAQTLPLPQYEITANINLSLIRERRGDYAAAEALLQQALAQAEQLAYHALDGIIYLNLGTMCLHQGDAKRGQSYYQAAQAEYRQSGNRINLGLSYHAQASVAREMGDFSTALDCFEQALALYRETGARHNHLIILSELGDLLRLAGKYTPARQYLQEALRLSAAIGKNVSRLNLLVKTAWLAVDVGDLAGAKTELARIDALLPDDQPVADKGLAYLLQAHYWHYRNDLAEARHCGEMALRLAQAHDRRLLPACMTRLGWILIERGERPYARDLFTAALEAYLADDQSHLAAEARAGLARIALDEGDLAAALAQVEAILQFLDSLNPPNTLVGTQIPALVYLACYEVLQADGDGRGTAVLDEGIDFLQERAAGLGERQRRAFWEDVPPNRKLAAAKKKSKKRTSTH